MPTIEDAEDIGRSRSAWGELRQRRTALLAIVPLLVIAAGFFMPPILHAPPTTPISHWDDGPSTFWSVDIVAVVLAALTAITAARRATPGGVVAALATAGILACGSPAVLLMWYLRLDPSDMARVTIGCAAVVVVALGLTIVAWRRSGWNRWRWLLAAYAVMVSLFGCPLIPGFFNLFSGGFVFLAAEILLVVLVASARSGSAAA